MRSSQSLDGELTWRRWWRQMFRSSVSSGASARWSRRWRAHTRDSLSVSALFFDWSELAGSGGV